MFKKILAYALTVCLLISATVVPAYAVDEVYSISDDTAPAPVIYYTEDYYPGLIAAMRSSMTFANNRIAHGSFATMNYNPSIFYREGSVHTSFTNYTIPFNSLTPYVTADQMDISGVYSIPRTTLLQGNMLIAFLPSTSDAYFDFQSSNIAFDQQDANANTFYINGTLTFNLRNLWNFSGTNETTSFYLASDPLAVQLLIDGKAYGDIIDVTGYTSPFTALYNGGVPANASVTFNNLKVYYQGDTPDMVGFRVYTGSAFTDGQYNYNNGGDFVGVDVTNTVTMRFSDLPDITFVQEGGDGYAGDLSGITGLLSDIRHRLTNAQGGRYLETIWLSLFDYSGGRAWLDKMYHLMVNNSGVSLFSQTVDNLASIYYQLVNSAGVSWLDRLYWQFNSAAGNGYLMPDGSGGTSTQELPFSFLFRYATLGLSQNIKTLIQQFQTYTGNGFLSYDGTVVNASGEMSFALVFRQATLGLANLVRQGNNYVSQTVFPWQSFNMQTHQLNASTNITGQNNLLLTAFQSMEDKLGRLAYVFGSDEDLALKDSADPGTDAFRENFGGGASLSDIKDASELTTSIPQIMDSGFDFGDALEEIGSNDDFLKWFTSETWAALDSTGAAVAADPDYLSDYYDNLRKVEEKRHWGD